MTYATITEVHTLNDALFEKVFMNEAPYRIAATVAACLLQATNTTDCDKVDEIRRLVADLCHDNEAGDDIIAMANQIQELRNRRQAEKLTNEDIIAMVNQIQELRNRRQAEKLTNEIKGYEPKAASQSGGGQPQQAPVTSNTPPWKRHDPEV